MSKMDDYGNDPHRAKIKKEMESISNQTFNSEEEWNVSHKLMRDLLQKLEEIRREYFDNDKKDKKNDTDAGI